MKVCIFGDSSTMVDILSKHHNLLLFVDNIIDANHAIKTYPNTKVSYNPQDICYQDAFIITSDINKNSSLIKRYGRLGATIVVEMVVDIGTTRGLFENGGYHVCYSPLFAPNDFKIIGALDDESFELVHQFYSSTFHVIKRAKTIEIAEAAGLYYHGKQIVESAFINEFNDHCMKHDVNIYDMVDITNAPLPTHGKTLVMPSFVEWPLLGIATSSLIQRPHKIVSYVKNKFIDIKGKNILVVGLGEVVGSSCYHTSPIKTIIGLLEQNDANVTPFDIFMEWCNTLPLLQNENGLDIFDIILVFQPYFMSKWLPLNHVFYFVRH